MLFDPTLSMSEHDAHKAYVAGSLSRPIYMVLIQSHHAILAHYSCVCLACREGRFYAH